MAGRTHAASLVVAAVLAVAGCGGDGASPSAEAWASDVCTRIAGWRTDVQKIAADATQAVTAPGATRKEIEDAVGEGVDATRSLAKDLRELGPPDTSEADEARASVETFADHLDASAQKVRRALDSVPPNAGPAEIVRSLSGLGSNLADDVASAQATLDGLRALGGDLRRAFEQADACDALFASD